MKTTTTLQLASAVAMTAASPVPPPVERASTGRAPVAFRIWAAGTNACDDGKTVVFSERSAAMLIAEQTARGRLYSFDFDHRSIMPGEAAEAGRAAGWHRLEVRAGASGPELWAVNCAWTEEARAGLEAQQWKYFSPAYTVDPKTREAVSYVNCALTNNPLTHGIPALASAVASTSAAGRLNLARARVRVLYARSRTVMASAIATNAEDLTAKPATPVELLAALAVVRNPNASEDEKGKALGILADHFSRIVEAQEASKEAGKNGKSKLASARERLAKVSARFERAEAASRTFAGRFPRTATHDPVVARIEACRRNSLASIAKRVVTASAVSGQTRTGVFVGASAEEIERHGRNTLASIR